MSIMRIVIAETIYQMIIGFSKTFAFHKFCQIYISLGLTQEGLFRVPGNQNEVEEMKNALNKGVQIIICYIYVLNNVFC